MNKRAASKMKLRPIQGLSPKIMSRGLRRMAVTAIRKEQLILASSLLCSVPLIGGCFAIVGFLYKWVESPELGLQIAFRIAIVLAAQFMAVWFSRRRIVRRVGLRKLRRLVYSRNQD